MGILIRVQPDLHVCCCYSLPPLLLSLSPLPLTAPSKAPTTFTSTTMKIPSTTGPKTHSPMSKPSPPPSVKRPQPPPCKLIIIIVAMVSSVPCIHYTVCVHVHDIHTVCVCVSACVHCICVCYNAEAVC